MAGRLPGGGAPEQRSEPSGRAADPHLPAGGLQRHPDHLCSRVRQAPGAARSAGGIWRGGGAGADRAAAEPRVWRCDQQLPQERLCHRTGGGRPQQPGRPRRVDRAGRRRGLRHRRLGGRADHDDAGREVPGDLCRRPCPVRTAGGHQLPGRASWPMCGCCSITSIRRFFRSARSTCRTMLPRNGKARAGSRTRSLRRSKPPPTASPRCSMLPAWRAIRPTTTRRRTAPRTCSRTACSERTICWTRRAAGR